MGERTWIVVAAFNESRGLGAVVSDLKRGGYDIVVVDDGSTDETGSIASTLGATVLRHLINMGQGAAVQTGIEYALARGADQIVTFDADGQHHVDDIRLLLDELERSGADFVLGSRFLGEAISIPSGRKLLLRAAVLFTQFTTRMRVTDTHNGFRAMTRRGAQAIHLRQNRMAHASEILHQIGRSRLRWVEAPVTIEYTEFTLQKGQKTTDFVGILFDLLMGSLER